MNIPDNAAVTLGPPNGGAHGSLTIREVNQHGPVFYNIAFNEVFVLLDESAPLSSEEAA